MNLGQIWRIFSTWESQEWLLHLLLHVKDFTLMNRRFAINLLYLGLVDSYILRINLTAYRSYFTFFILFHIFVKSLIAFCSFYGSVVKCLLKQFV